MDEPHHTIRCSYDSRNLHRPSPVRLRAACGNVGVIPFGATVFLSGFARSKRLSRPSDSAVAPVHVTAMSPGRIISSEPLRTVN
jgi:hypothetical protein